MTTKKNRPKPSEKQTPQTQGLDLGNSPCGLVDSVAAGVRQLQAVNDSDAARVLNLCRIYMEGRMQLAALGKELNELADDPTERSAASSSWRPLCRRSLAAEGMAEAHWDATT